MKKTLLLIAILFAAFTMNAQYVIVDQDGNEFTDGMVYETASLIYEEAEWQFYITNNGAESINMRIEFVSAVNGNGNGFQLCFGQCYIDLVVGQTVPPTPGFIAIASGETTGVGNHYYNSNAGDGVSVQDYVFRYYETDGNGVDIGNPLTVTYRYSPLLGTEDFNELNVNISSTIIETEMIVNTVEELDMVVYDLQGRLVKNQKLNIGQQNIDMSDLSAQLYIVKFNNNDGASKTTKVLVK
jgi:hypothetical protein